MKVRYAIIGAGPAGLAFALGLLERGETSFLVLEQEATAGGLCRSVELDGSPFDFGGGHILDVKNIEARDFVFRYLPEKDWNTFSRCTKIVVGDHEIDYPFEANIWQLPDALQEEYLDSIKQAGCLLGAKKPARFIDWVRWKLGDRIAETYMIPYNEKIFSCDLNTLGTYWLNKLPDVSYEEVLESCRRHQPFGTLPAHANFYYPKRHGYGEAFLRMADELGQRIEYNVPVTRLDPERLTINGTVTADCIINTAPWETLSKDFPAPIRDEIALLAHAGTDTDYVSDCPDTPAHWTYYADRALSYHRIIHRHNLQPGAKGCWTETNTKRRKPDAGGADHFENEYAYPLNTLAKPEAIKKILAYGSERRIFGLGRWGEWEHYNSDVVISRGFKLADTLLNR